MKGRDPYSYRECKDRDASLKKKKKKHELRSMNEKLSKRISQKILLRFLLYLL